MAIAEGTTQCRHMDAKIALLNERIGPDPRDNVLLGDNRAGASD